MKELNDIAKAKAALVAACETLRLKRGRQKLECYCGGSHAIGTLKLLVTHWYTEPHGCTGGDYWSEGEWQFLCPKDGTRNRLLFSDRDVDWDKRDHVNVAAEPTFKYLYRQSFGTVEKVYKDDCLWEKSPWWNNYYVDEHRKRFGLPVKKVAK